MKTMKCYYHPCTPAQYIVSGNPHNLCSSCAGIQLERLVAQAGGQGDKETTTLSFRVTKTPNLTLVICD